MSKYLRVRSSVLYMLPSTISSLPHYLICPAQTKNRWIVRVYDDFVPEIEVSDDELRIYTSPLEGCDYWITTNIAYGEFNEGRQKIFKTEKQKYHWRVGLFVSRRIAKHGTSANPRIAARQAIVRIFKNMPALERAWPRTREG